ncbi:MAG: CdaR family protein [Oscillospiraceae bacterium]|nr:CdaR family protein [Oscillospiraceae bacterium]
MLGKKLNKIFSSRVFYIVFAVVVAAALWIFVEGDDPRTQRVTVDLIPVTLRNEALLSDRGLIITAMERDTVTITFEGSRAGLSQLSRNSVTVEVDLSGITTTGDERLEFEVILPSGVGRTVSELSRSPTRIGLTVDRLFERSIPVRGEYTGGTAHGTDIYEYLVGEPEFGPQMITVSGPERVVARVSEAWVPIMRENLSATYIDYLPFILRDENGYELSEEELEQLEVSHDLVRVTVPISAIRPVPLTVLFMHGAGTTDYNTFVDIFPDKIYVSGDPDAIRELNEIPLGTIDLTRIELSDSELFPIIVQNNFINHSGETEATVRVEVRGLEVWSFSVSNIHTSNDPGDYTLTVITRSLDVRIRGRREELEALTETNFRIVADLAGLSVGSHQVPVTVWIDGDVGNVGPVGEYTITVRLDRVENSS